MQSRHKTDTSMPKSLVLRRIKYMYFNVFL